MSDVAHPTDRQPVPGARLADLDLSLVQRHITIAKERGRYDWRALTTMQPAWPTFSTT